MPAVRLLADTTRVGEATANRDGRWRLNAGNEMIVSVPSLNDGEPIRLVLDIASSKFAAAKVVALDNHDKDGKGIQSVVGFWDGATNDGFLEADLHVTTATTEAEGAALQEAVRLKAHIRNGVPIQASVGAEAGPGGKWELVPEGSRITVNGREYQGAAGSEDSPLYILRGGLITESSVVVFGADSETGRVAAAKITSPVVEAAMSTLKAILGKYPEKHHGLVARLVAAETDEATITTKVHAAEMEDKDAIIARLNAALEAAKKAGSPDDQDDEDDDEGMEAGADPVSSTQRNSGRSELEPAGSLTAGKRKGKFHRGSRDGIRFQEREGRDDQPRTEAAKLEAARAKVSTVFEGMQFLKAQGSKLDGFKLREAARREFPKLDPKAG